MIRFWELPFSIPALYIYNHLTEKESVNTDLMRNGFSADGAGFFRAYILSPLFRKVFYYRSAKEFPWLTKVSKFFYKGFPTMELEAEKIGGGMIVYHGYSTIVFAKEIGENFTVYQQVTVGRGKNINGNDIPIIGNGVTIYAGAIVIGAGAVVVKDVPAGATVVGNSARVIMEEYL